MLPCRSIYLEVSREQAGVPMAQASAWHLGILRQSAHILMISLRLSSGAFSIPMCTVCFFLALEMDVRTRQELGASNCCRPCYCLQPDARCTQHKHVASTGSVKGVASRISGGCWCVRRKQQCATTVHVVPALSQACPDAWLEVPMNPGMCMVRMPPLCKVCHLIFDACLIKAPATYAGMPHASTVGWVGI